MQCNCGPFGIQLWLFHKLGEPEYENQLTFTVISNHLPILVGRF
ncbi:hypothetical protein HMPREF6485_0732 [Segatella buccae ATCC 33574]|uniref:Uncharacterized protein n=1 Tax=Segatella buccae ATCC 33574 TaxID=873513 RepID=E6K4Z6_9BACT|nr:hypothetical protein HMPREF6485_0732 [Segatella buccae ATCC 33574]